MKTKIKKKEIDKKIYKEIKPEMNKTTEKKRRREKSKRERGEKERNLTVRWTGFPNPILAAGSDDPKIHN